MARLKDILQTITVSDKRGADFSSLNSAINSTDVKTFTIESAIVLTDNISIPSGVTIIIGTQGSLSGAYTLTGNDTVLMFEGKNKAIGLDVMFAGSWITGIIDVNNFNVTADGLTDDSAPIQQAFNLAKLTEHKSVRLGGTYKVVTIETANCRILGSPKIIGTNGYPAISASGSQGAFYNLDTNGLLGAYSIVCSNTTFLASITVGDLLNVSSNLLYADGYNQGEIVEIIAIAGSTIYFKAPLHMDYLTANGAKVSRISPVSLSNDGVLTVEFPVDLVNDINIDRYTTGIYVIYGKDVTLNVSTLKTGSRGVALAYCYRPIVKFRGTQGECPGYGYGVSVVGATMFADVSGSARGYRHCVQHGGSTNGIPWESHIHDFYGSVVLATGATAFDTHPSTGSVMYSDCVAEGDNTYSGALVGFLTNGANVSFNNCEARNLGTGVMLTDPTCKNISIKNFRCIDVNYGLLIGPNAIVENLEIDGISVVNSVVRTGAVMSFGAGQIDRLSISNVSGINIRSIANFSTSGLYPSKLYMKNVSCINDTDSTTYAIRINDANITEVVIDGLITKKCNYILQALTPLSLFIMRNFKIEETTGVNILAFSGAQGIAVISNGEVDSPLTANTALVSFAEGVATLGLFSTILRGSNLEHITKVVSGKTFSNFIHSGNIIDHTLTATHETQTPTTTIIDGSIGI